MVRRKKSHAAARWNGLRLRLAALWLVVAFGGLALLLAGAELLHDLAPVHLLTSVVGWLGLLALVLMWVREFRCPRCERHFYRRGWRFAPLQPHCSGCHVPRD